MGSMIRFVTSMLAMTISFANQAAKKTGRSPRPIGAPSASTIFIRWATQTVRPTDVAPRTKMKGTSKCPDHKSHIALRAMASRIRRFTVDLGQDCVLHGHLTIFLKRPNESRHYKSTACLPQESPVADFIRPRRWPPVPRPEAMSHVGSLEGVRGISGDLMLGSGSSSGRPC